jgi:hypothetical protein
LTTISFVSPSSPPTHTDAHLSLIISISSSHPDTDTSFFTKLPLSSMGVKRTMFSHPALAYDTFHFK